MIVFVLSLIDIIVGLSLITDWLNFSFIYLAWIILIKGIFSFLGSLTSGYVFDWMGIVDIVVGFSMILSTFGIVVPLFSYLGYVMILKGIYCIIRVLLKF